jgi:imidazolonepropionase-like amidohydrolase
VETAESDSMCRRPDDAGRVNPDQGDLWSIIAPEDPLLPPRAFPHKRDCVEAGRNGTNPESRSREAILIQLLILALLPASFSAHAQNDVQSSSKSIASIAEPSVPTPQRALRSPSPLGAAQPSALFAHVAVGSRSRTVFTFLNTGGSTLSGTLILTARDGSPMRVRLFLGAPDSDPAGTGASGYEIGSSLPMTIPPGGTQFIVASAVSPADPDQTGWAQVESYGGSLGSVATFQRLDAQGRVSSSAGVISSEAVRAVTIPVEDDRGQNRYTGYAVANPGSEGISIKGELFASDLDFPVGSFTLSLGPGEQLARFFFESTAMPEEFRGSVVLTEQGGRTFAAVALVQDSALHTAIPAIAMLPPANSLLALTNGTLIDGTGSDPLRDAVVLIRDDRIDVVGPAGSVAIPPTARIIDVRGATVLPGFINTHVHSAFIDSSLQAWAQAGVTTVRDMGFQAVHMWWPMTVRDQRKQYPRYARIVTAGVPISSPGGYPLEDGKTSVLTAASPEEARARTTMVLDHGADFIKASLESGLIVRGRPDLPVFTREESRAIIETAHRRGVPVTVHVTAVMDLVKAVDYGFDEIAHMVADTLSDEQLIGRMVASNTYWVPTLELWSFFDLAPAAVANLRRFVQAGGKIALGTDYSGAAKPFQLGMPMHEIELMQEAGMTPMQIIVAATKNAAHVCNLEAILGTLERGKVADVLVVNGDPLQDLHALTNVRLVVRSGTIIRDTGN